MKLKVNESMFKAAFAASDRAGIFSEEALKHIYIHLTSMEPAVEIDFDADDIADTFVEINKRDVPMMEHYDELFTEVAILKESVVYGDLAHLE